MEKTNPPASLTSLCEQQLAAARLLACGLGPVEVAAELRLSRQTLWRWRRMSEFNAEVFRLHECLTWTAGATATRAPARQFRRFRVDEAVMTRASEEKRTEDADVKLAQIARGIVSAEVESPAGQV
jgi:hypothetical protein